MRTTAWLSVVALIHLVAVGGVMMLQGCGTRRPFVEPPPAPVMPPSEAQAEGITPVPAPVFQPPAAGDQLGVGLNWGEVNQSTFGEGLDDQVTTEVFYRAQITPQFALTPSVEYIHSPALNPENSGLWVVGIRARMAL